MPRGYSRGALILSEDGHIYSHVYRGIMELLARFGYVSIREVMYGFRLNLTQAVDRLRYLEQQEFIRRFPSKTIPPSFFCLTSLGREAVQGFSVSEELTSFNPNQYQLVYQHHHRAIVKAFLALKNILGADFLNWMSETTLRAEGTDRKLKRILDGELHLRVFKTRFLKDPTGELQQHGNPVPMEWRCGVEVELSLKSPYRYWKQFKDLAHQAWDSYSREQRYPMLFFLYSTQTIHERLVNQLKVGNHNFGSCVFLFAQIDEFISKLGDAPVERWIEKDNRTIQAAEMNKVKVMRS